MLQSDNEVCPWLVTNCPNSNLLLVCGPGHTDNDKKVDLAASVSSLCLEEATSTAGPSMTASAVIFGSWSMMRKASAPFVIDNDVADTSLEI